MDAATRIRPLIIRAFLAGALLTATGCGMMPRGRATKSRNTAQASAAPSAKAAPVVRELPPATPAKAPTSVSDYIILPSDILEIVVFQEPDLKSTLRVSNEGTIVFPLIGVVPIGGMTPQGAAQALRDRLAKGFLINPQVSVTVMEFSKRRFTVLGEVQKPGSYDMPAQQDVTVLQAIGMAGGYTRIANPTKVTLMRKLEGTPKTFALDAKQMARGNSESAFIVQPGDVITVAESRF